jgi:hypothetical protein
MLRSSGRAVRICFHFARYQIKQNFERFRCQRYRNKWLGIDPVRLRISYYLDNC